MFRKLVTASLQYAGFEIRRISTAAAENNLSDLPSRTLEIIKRARPYTMTSNERLAALSAAVEYAVENGIVGSFVECGVWRGGSSMAAALTYLAAGRDDVDLFLFDTFEGMSAPTSADVDPATGRFASELLGKAHRSAEIWAYSPLEEVRANLFSTGYPPGRIHFIQGLVENTVPSKAPNSISVLRLDTDWYESTKHELEHLFDRLSPKGVLIIDDYGAWAGARKAVDEFLASRAMRPMLFRIDQTGRMLVKEP